VTFLISELCRGCHGRVRMVIFGSPEPKVQVNYHIIGPGSHVEYPTGTKNSNFLADHPRNISAKFGSNWPSGFGES
jgi:hypothetical protein